MKKYVYISLLCITMLMVVSSCTKVLDKTDLNSFSSEQVFNNIQLANSFLSKIYDDNSPGWPGRWEEVTDETDGGNDFFQGTVQTNTVSDYGTQLRNNTVWGKLRSINKFIQKVDEGTLSESQKKMLKGQALFFRAWRYYELIKLYGGVPLVLEPLEAIGPEAEVKERKPRAPTSEVIAQITTDLDSAIVYLPGRWEGEDWGRITSGAAAALKGRVLLYWASPQFNPDDKQERWQAAYEANKQAIQLLTNNGFGLNSDFQNMWFQEVGNPEAVWSVGYNNATGDQIKKNEGWDNSTRPAYLGTGGGANQPTKTIVDAFPMKSGLSIDDPNSNYDSTLFYKNRDPRFYATIAFNGTTWHINGNEDYRLWTYEVDNTSVEPNATGTGFYCRKAIDPDLPADQVKYAGTDWMEIRYAEVVLNLAESANGIDRQDEAYEGIKKIRRRAGVEPGSNNMYGLETGMTRDEMFQAILHERQVEFAFEGRRYWDLRRWKLFESKLNGTRRKGVVISLDTSAINADDFKARRDTMDLDKAYENYFEMTTKTLDSEYAINWQPNYYFFAIPQSAIDNNPKLKQTQGWNNGTFDPLK